MEGTVVFATLTSTVSFMRGFGVAVDASDGCVFADVTVGIGLCMKVASNVGVNVLGACVSDIVAQPVTRFDTRSNAPQIT